MKRKTGLFELGAAVALCLAITMCTVRLAAGQDQAAIEKAELNMLRSTVKNQAEQIDKLKSENARLAEQVKRLEELSAKAGKATSQPAAAPTTVPAARTKVLDKWSGFRDLKWGTKIADVPGMILVKDSGDSKRYRREGDKLAIGEAELKEIDYVFYKGRFYCLWIESVGYSNWKALKDAVFATYGKGDQPNEFIEKYYWFNREDVGMSLDYNEFAKRTIICMFYNPIRDEEKADQAKKAKEAGKDF